jgi:hypothetical protein
MHYHDSDGDGAVSVKEYTTHFARWSATVHRVLGEVEVAGDGREPADVMATAAREEGGGEGEGEDEEGGEGGGGLGGGDGGRDRPGDRDDEDDEEERREDEDEDEDEEF